MRETRPAPTHRSSFGALVVHATVINGLLIAVRLVASYRALALDADALGLGIVASAYALDRKSTRLNSSHT